MRNILITVPAALALMGAREPSDTQSAALVGLEPISVPIVDGGRINGSLDVRLTIRPVEGGGDALAAAMPHLRAAAREVLSEHARLHASPWQAVDASQLVSTLTASVKRAAPKADKVLLIEVRAHPA